MSRILRNTGEKLLLGRLGSDSFTFSKANVERYLYSLSIDLSIHEKGFI